MEKEAPRHLRLERGKARETVLVHHRRHHLQWKEERVRGSPAPTLPWFPQDPLLLHALTPPSLMPGPGVNIG